MAFPAIASVVQAMHDHPDEFAIQDGMLEHRDRPYRFKIDRFGLLVVQLEGEDAQQLVAGDDAHSLQTAFDEWQRRYWAPVKVNQLFAQQLRRHGLWARLRYWLECSLPERRHERALAIYGQAFAGIGPPGGDRSDEPPPRRSPPVPRPPLPCSGGRHDRSETRQYQAVEGGVVL